MAVREYRAIATATRARLKRGRLLYLRLVWPSVLRHPDPRLATWYVAERMRKAGLYALGTGGEDAACGCVKWWFKMFGPEPVGWQSRGGPRQFFAWLDERGLAFRMSKRDVKRWEAELRAKETTIRFVPYPGGFMVYATVIVPNPRPVLVGSCS